MDKLHQCLAVCCWVAAGIAVNGCAFIKADCASPQLRHLNVGESAAFEVQAVEKCNKSGILIEKGAYYAFDITPEGLADCNIAEDPPKSGKPLTAAGYQSHNQPFCTRPEPCSLSDRRRIRKKPFKNRDIIFIAEPCNG